MKKTLLALSVTGALVSAAGAAPQVEVYGLLDTGVSYVHTDADIAGVADTDTFSHDQRPGIRLPLGSSRR
ncbi:MAG: hypothetical protein V8R49_09605 [Duodenibacillus massiliensis]